MLETLTVTALLFHTVANQPARPADPPPYAGEWVVDTIDNIKVMPESQVTLRIQQSQVNGLAACNTYRGSFTVDGATVKVGELLKTMKACDQPRMSEENEFLAVLRQVVRYDIRPDDTLVLTTSDRRTIVAKRP